MSVILSSLFAALIPVGVEGVKQVVASKFPTGVKATTIAEQLQIDESEIKRAQAIAALDNPGGTSSQWVVDLRASSRYLAAWGAIGIGSYLLTTPIAVAGVELISVAFGFLFGTRLVANWIKK